MRKVFCCCVAAGAVVCCAFWTAAYVSQNPDSALGRCALAVCPVGPHAAPAASGRPGQPGATATDDLVPDDPVPVDDPPPVPTPGSHVPPEVMALGTPPIIIHDEEEDLNASANPALADPLTTKHVDEDGDHPSAADAGLAARTDGGLEVRPTSAPPVMPRCSEDDDYAPLMPYCTDDDAAPAAGPKDGRKVIGAPYRDFDACAFWTGFFTGPTHLFGDAGGRCEEDVHYPQQYSGVPYTGPADAQPIQQTSAHEKPLPSLPAVEEPSEPPAPKEEKQQADPSELFDHPHHLQISRPSEPRSDTMEMRPSDWKPYSLDPGPF